MERDIRARVTKLAPFLQFDADPYPVVLGNRTVWVIDAYTTTDQYPYSQSLERRAGLAQRTFNYVRNSVKVTVDAYEGTVKFYVFDKKDPIIKAYAEAFPDLFTDGSRMPEALREHLRYPEDLFKAQADHVRPLPRDRAASGSTTAAPTGWCRPTRVRVAVAATCSPRRRPPPGPRRRRRATSRRPRRRPGRASIRTT